MLSALQAALTDPGSFFEREIEDPSLRGPVVVVAAVAVVGLVSSVPVFRSVMGMVPEDAAAFVLIFLAFGALVGLAGPFVVWFVYAALFHLLSVAFDGEGQFRDVFTLVGWGFAPRVLAQVVSGAVLLVLFSQGDLSTPQEAQRLARSVTSGPLGLVSRGVGLLMTLWSAWVWTHALAVARDLEFRQSAVCVGVVVVAGVLLGFASTALA